MRQWAGERPLPISVVLAVIATLAAAYFVIDAGAGPTPAWRRFAADLIPDVVVALLAYLTVNYLLFHHNAASARELTDAIARRVADLRPSPDTGVLATIPARVPWSRFVGHAGQSMVLFARFWDEEAASVRRELIEFFEAGGTLEVFLCDPDDEALVELCARELCADMQPDPRQVRRRILRTVCELQAAHERARRSQRWVRSSQLVVRYVKHAANYSVAIFDGSNGRYAVMAPSPHFYVPEAPPITLCVDLVVARPLAEFLDAELTLMRRRDRGRAVDLGAARREYARMRDTDAGAAAVDGA